MVETQFKYSLGQAVRERASAASGAATPKFVVAERGYFEGQPAYILNEVGSGAKRGWFSEDMIEPYDDAPGTHPSEESP